MISRRVILGILLIIPLVMIYLAIRQAPAEPDPTLELVFLVIGVPILVLNAWEWFEPEMREFLFPTRMKQ